MIHEIKISPRYFNEVVKGNKRFEIRKDDRSYEIGDLINLREYTDGEYTGRDCTLPIQYILRDCPEHGLMDGYCILGLGDKIENKGMTIRAIIDILMDAPDKDKPLIVECKKDVLKDHDHEWGQLEITNLVNCTHSSIAEARKREE